MIKDKRRIAVVINTYNRVEDVKINQQIIRNRWSKLPNFQTIDIYHAYNGKKELYPSKHLEDNLVYRPTKGHFMGAADLLDSAFEQVLSSNNHYDYIVAMSADTFITKPEFLEKTMQLMDERNIQLTTSLWLSMLFIPHYFSTEFFIINPELASKVFPLRLEDYVSERPLTRFLSRICKPLPIITVPLVELCFTNKVLRAVKKHFWLFNWRKDVYIIKERKMVWFANRFHTQSIGYYSHHNLDEKLKIMDSEAAR